MDGITPFLNRAEDYRAARPDYPKSLVALLKDRCGLEMGCRVADVGSGTGIFSNQLLKAGATVFAVEPNDSMRKEAEEWLGENPSFVSLNSTAEDLPFDDAALDLITCGQSFHWFNFDKVKEEFSRVLHGAGWVAVFWNRLRLEKNEATDALHLVLQKSQQLHKTPTDLGEARKDISTFFAPGTHNTKQLSHIQELELDGVIMLCRSRSYWPDPESPDGLALEAELRESVGKSLVGKKIVLQYFTDVHFGQME